MSPLEYGKEDDQALAQEVQQLLPLAPEWLRNKPEDCWERARPRALLERKLSTVMEKALETPETVNLGVGRGM